MSTRSTAVAKPLVPDTLEEFIPLTRLIRRRVGNLADHQALFIRVLAEEFGAPAMYIPALAEIHVLASVLQNVDMREISSWDEFVAKYPAEAGVLIHEIAHCAHSLRLKNLESLRRTFGDRHYATYGVLDEGRVESLIWKYRLDERERQALRSMILSIVLSDIKPTESFAKEGEEDLAKMLKAINLLGLVAARIENGLLDMSLPKTLAIHTGLISILGDYHEGFWRVANEVGSLDLGYDRTENIDRLNALIREWMAMEDAVILEFRKPPEGTPPPPPGGKKQEEDEESEGTGTPQPQGGGEEEQEEGEEPTEGEPTGGGEDEGEGKPQSRNDGDPDVVGDDDEGTVGDGTKILKKGGKGRPSLGEYAGGEEVASIDVDDLVGTITDAAVEQEHVAGSRLKESLTSIQNDTANYHSRRRQLNREAQARW